MTIKGRLLSSVTNAKALDCVYFLCVTFWPWTVANMASHVTNRATKYEDPLPTRSWVTFPIGYHWKCVRGHCACAESRDPWVGGQKQLHFYDLPIHYTTFIGLRRWHLFYKQSYSKYSVKTRWIFVTLATRVVWAKFDWHHLIGRSRKPPTACKHLGRTSCTR